MSGGGDARNWLRSFKEVEIIKTSGIRITIPPIASTKTVKVLIRYDCVLVLPQIRLMPLVFWVISLVVVNVIVIFSALHGAPSSDATGAMWAIADCY